MTDIFLQHIKSYLNPKCGYVLGAQGQVMTEHLIDILKCNYSADNRDYFANMAKKWINYVCFDCSGMIVYTLQRMSLFNSTEDYTAEGLYDQHCIPISRNELRSGDLVFNSDLSHVGVYVDGKVIHARGTFYGVVETALFSSFVKFGRLECLKGIMTIVEFQKKNKLEIDGLIGPATTKKIFEVLSDDKEIFNKIKEMIK